MSKSPDNDSLVISYLSLRKAIGVIGITLPLVLVIGKNILQNPGILNSMSSYYYSIMGDVFVGSLCAMGVFLLSYHGYEKKDDIAGDIAGLAAVGVALFPTTPGLDATTKQIIIGNWHLFFATVFILTLAYFSLFLFRKTKPNSMPTPQKKLRNIIYTICGISMVICISLMLAVIFFPGVKWLHIIPNPIFWLETLANFSFGLSWFVKGEAILQDQ